MKNENELEETKSVTTEVALETIITNAVKILGVKVDRKKFLANETDDMLSKFQSLL